MTRTPSLLASLFIAAVLQADITLAPLFRDHAVLQRDRLLPVWGRAEPGEVVQVAFRGREASAVTNADGRWCVTLPPLPASAEPAELTASGRNLVRIADILVGEVWLCSGQSNMEYPVNPERVPPDNLRLDNQEAETAAARHPLIRRFKVARQPAEHPLDSVGGAWAVCAPETMRTFTAAGYFFARDIHQALAVPVGIIDSSWGGTPIESWLSAAALASDPAFAAVGERWSKSLELFPARIVKYEADLRAWQGQAEAAAARGSAVHEDFLRTRRPPKRPLQGPGTAWAPGALYNGMIAPLVPYAIRGVLWYQGESNVPRAGEYGALFRGLITSWRDVWGQGDFPFLFVQLAAHADEHTHYAEWAWLREAQARALTLPATAMAVAIDNPDPANLHPGNKQVIGRRLALLARARVYGLGGESSGPVVRTVTRETGGLRVRFAHAGKCVLLEGPATGFELAGADRVFHPAVACVEDDSVLLSSAAVAAPVVVRYAWADAPAVTLFNGAGLPAAPFRTDAW